MRIRFPSPSTLIYPLEPPACRDAYPAGARRESGVEQRGGDLDGQPGEHQVGAPAAVGLEAEEQALHPGRTGHRDVESVAVAARGARERNRPGHQLAERAEDQRDTPARLAALAIGHAHVEVVEAERSRGDGAEAIAQGNLAVDVVEVRQAPPARAVGGELGGAGRAGALDVDLAAADK